MSKAHPVPRLFQALTLSLILGLSTSAQAAKMAAFCTWKDDGSSSIKGENISKRLPIASVSKVMTAWWGLTAKGEDYRFQTRIHATPAGEGLYDLHLEGSRDPYFGKESLHFMISELNRHQITKINRLTFDPNFKFYWNVTSNDVAVGHYTTASPKPTTVKAQLMAAGGLLKGYQQTRESAKAKGVTLVANPSFQVKTIEPIELGEFQRQIETRTLFMKSSPILALAKEMNRNSNNHAANQIFEHLGGASAFHSFAQERLNLERTAIRFVNGSGDRADLESGATYNEATCEATLKILKDLRSTLKKSNKDLQHVMAVAGGDTNSTTHKLYNNDMTDEALIGKTGTVNPSITLAGIVHSNSGDYYFMYNVGTKGTSADWRTARALIREKVTGLIRSLKGSDPIDYNRVSFLSFDGDSDLIMHVTPRPRPTP